MNTRIVLDFNINFAAKKVSEVSICTVARLWLNKNLPDIHLSVIEVLTASLTPYAHINVSVSFTTGVQHFNVAISVFVRVILLQISNMHAL